MKTSRACLPITTASGEASAVSYQFHLQNRAGLLLPGDRSDSAPEAVATILSQVLASEGGGVRLVDHHDLRMVATVERRTEKSDFGFPVHHRVNRFRDTMFEQLAAVVLAREILRESVGRSIPAGARSP